MKKRWPLFLLFIALAGAAFWLWRGDRGNTLAVSDTSFAVPDTAKIDRIFIADRSGSVADLRRTPNGWTVNGLPATPVPINLLLRTFRNVQVRSPVPKSAERQVLKLMSSTALKVEIYQGGKKPARIWWVGHGTQDHVGTYMLLETPEHGKSDSPYVLDMAGFTGVLNTRFHTRLDEWRATVVTNYPDLNKVKRIAVRHPSTDSTGFDITFDGGSNLHLLDTLGNEVPMDSANVKDLLLLLRDGHFECFERGITKAQRDSVLATKPWHVLTVTSDKGTLRIPFWKKNPRPGEKDLEFRLLVDDINRMYAVVEDTCLVVVQRYWYDRVVPPLSRLRAHPAPAEQPPPPGLH
ncbi:MAG: hypothetical protein QM724_08365 [Flavobacteriales bacterium]